MHSFFFKIYIQMQYFSYMYIDFPDLIFFSSASYLEFIELKLYFELWKR